MNANDKLKKWINHNYLTKGDRRMITDKTKWDDENYYSKNFKEIMYDKITEGIDLTEGELKELIYDYRHIHVDEISGDDLRWVKPMTSIIKIRDKYFAIDWFKGLTEMQGDEFYDQPYEVKRVDKMVPVTEWVPEEYNDFDQKNPYHMESLGKHMTDAYDFSKKIHNDYSVLVATKYHDMGKLYTQTFDEDGVAHYYGHENIGAYMILVYEVANQHCLFVNHNIGDIAFYINYHMLPFQWKPISECDNKWIKIMGHKKYENLWSLHIADSVASKREKGLSEALKAKRGFDNEFDL